MGLLAAEGLLAGESPDLWAVNTDYEAYQEAAEVHKTGLEPVAAHAGVPAGSRRGPAFARSGALRIAGELQPSSGITEP
jgi:hypothetical protein